MKLGLFFLLLHALSAGSTTSPVVELHESLELCKPANEFEEDVSSSDPLVAHMFEAYKIQAAAENPPAEYSTTLANVDAHKLLARVFFFIYNVIQDREENAEKKHLRTMPSPISYIFNLVETSPQRWADDRNWPFRCYDVTVAKALDGFLSASISHIQTSSMHPTSNFPLSWFLFSVSANLPQFQKYVGPLTRQPFGTICQVILNSDDRARTVMLIKKTVVALLPLAEDACRLPYDVNLYCRFRGISNALLGLNIDLEAAGDSLELQDFSFLWLYDSSLGRTCDYTSTNYLLEVLLPIHQRTFHRLQQIAAIPSITGGDLNEVRTFVYDYYFTAFRKYAMADLPVLEVNLQPPFNEPGNKYYTFYFPHNHSNPETIEKDLVKLFRGFMRTLVDIENVLVEGGSVAEVRALARLAASWFLHPQFEPTPTTFNAFIDGVTYALQHKPIFDRFYHAMSVYQPPFQCDFNGKVCDFFALLIDINSYGNIMSTDDRVKILNPTSDYKKILELDTMLTMRADIAALEAGQETLKESLLNMRRGLGEHFYQLATFDQDKAEYDVGYLKDKIADFNGRIANTGLEEKLRTLLKLAFGSNLAELTQLAAQFATALAASFNPMKWISGKGLDGLNEVLDRANDLAQAGIATAKLIAIGSELMPELATKADGLNIAMSNNALIHTKLNTTFHSLKDKVEIEVDTVQAQFLLDYRGYDPGWSKGDIADYTMLLQQVIEGLCDILYEGTTVASAVAQGIGATKNVCLRIKRDAEVLDAVYNEMYDFQYEFMDAMAAAIRALISKHSANSLKQLPEEPEQDEITYVIQLKLYVFRIKLQSKHHVALALKAVCDVDEYKNGGVQTSKCTEALGTQMLPAINQVLGDRVAECEEGRIMEIYGRIPAKTNEDKEILEQGVIDLTKLYSGQWTAFQIPYAASGNWFHRFVSHAVPIHEDVALYLHRFELFLPDMSVTSQQVPHDVVVTVKQGRPAIVRQSGSIKYGFTNSTKFRLQYGENKATCATDFEDSAYPELCDPGPSQICTALHGVIARTGMAVPIYNDWLIRADLPRGLVAPNPIPETVFYLRAKFGICIKNPMNIDLTGLRPEIPITSANPDRCCPANQYWYISEFLSFIQKCLPCPTDSDPVLGGLFCQKRPEPAEIPLMKTPQISIPPIRTRPPRPTQPSTLPPIETSPTPRPLPPTPPPLPPIDASPTPLPPIETSTPPVPTDNPTHYTKPHRHHHTAIRQFGWGRDVSPTPTSPPTETSPPPTVNPAHHTKPHDHNYHHTTRHHVKHKLFGRRWNAHRRPIAIKTMKHRKKKIYARY